jgi:hypothetical protein
VGTIVKWIGYITLSIIVVSIFVGGGLAIAAVVAALSGIILLCVVVMFVATLIKSWFGSRKSGR